MSQRPSHQPEKNFLALSIVLGGLFLGSLLVDIGQLVIGRGFSQHVIRDHDVLEQNGKTWVAFTDPKVALTVLTDTKCAACHTDEALVWLRRVIPTLSVSTMEVDSEAGQALAIQHGITAVPAFLFQENITRTDFYTQATSLFSPSDREYLLNLEAIGLPAGRYLRVPEVTPESVTLGTPEAPVRVVIYSDFLCNYCAGFHKNQIKKLLDEYHDRVAFVFKQFPLETHPKSPLIANAALCAHEQGKYFTYASALYGKQRELERRADTKQELKNLAWTNKLNWKVFSDCLDQNRFQTQVQTEGDEARSLNLSAAPAVFIGNRLFSGAGEYEVLRQAIEESLSQQ